MPVLKRIRTRIDHGAAGSDAEGIRGSEEEEEPVTPAGRVFLQPELYLNALCILGFKQPVDLQAFKQELLQTLVKHKRFSSVVRLNKRGRECWVRTEVNIDEHVVVPSFTELELESPRLVEDYVARISHRELDMNKPLWEAHVLNTTSKFPDSASVKTGGVCIFILHHSLGDGTSLMSLLLACTRRADDPQSLPTIPGSGAVSSRRTNPSWFAAMWRLCLVVWFSITEILKFLCMQLWQRDNETIISGYRGAENEPSHFSTVHFELDDFKTVKKAAGGGATINDVFLALVSMALSRYLNRSTSTHSLGKLRVRALAIMNTRPSPGLQELGEMMKNEGSEARWGNNIGYILIPLTMKRLRSPLEYVWGSRIISARKKLSLEAWFTYSGGALVMMLLGVKAATLLTYRSILHTSLSISNVMGPVEEVTFAGNSLEYIIPTSSKLPQGPLIHFSSYMGRVTLSFMINKKIFTDPEFLLKCFHHSMQELVIDSTKFSQNNKSFAN